MATEVGAAPVNGTYAPQQTTYGAVEGFNHQPSNSTSTTGYGSAPASSSTPQQGEISKEEVAWYFVEQYYTTMSRSPDKLYVRFHFLPSPHLR